MARRVPFRDFLSQSALLSGLDLESRVAASRAIRPRPFGQGEVILEQGSLDRGILLILAGQARLEVEEDGLYATVVVLGKGELLGMGRLFDPHHPRHCSVVGHERGLAAFIPALVYQEAARLGHPLARNIENLAMQSLLRRERISQSTFAALQDEKPRPRWQGV